MKRLAVVVLLFLAACNTPTANPRLPEVPASSNPQTAMDFQAIVKAMIGGGPLKDGIPSIDEPVYVSAEEADLSDEQIVFGVDYNGFVAAYPENIMVWHEAVNEVVAGEKITVTYCPLTKSVIGFKGRNLGISGKLYNSNLVLYDRATDSLIPQMLETAVKGPLQGKRLETFPVIVTTWKLWKQQNPNTKVLSRKTGFLRDYDHHPYLSFYASEELFPGVQHLSDALPRKQLVYGFEHSGSYLAVKKEDVRNVGNTTVKLGNEKVTLFYNKNLDVVEAVDSSGQPLHGFEVFWFAWHAYHPDSEVYGNAAGTVI